MRTTSTFDNWVECYEPNPQARLRLFCFPYAGGGASVFRPWSGFLPMEIEICSIQLPGREIKLLEPPFTRLSPLVQTLAQVLRSYLEMPFAFFGHSMGALISFELTRELRRQRMQSPAHLFISGNRAPQLPDPDPPVHQLPESEFVEEIRNLDGTPEEILQNAEFLELFVPLLRADFAISETYVYTKDEPLDCPISVFGGLEDSEVSRDELEAWRFQTRSSFTLRMFSGNHFFLKSTGTLFLQVLSQYLTQLLKGKT